MAENEKNDVLEAIRKEADRIEEDSLYSAKGQWETAREQGWLHLFLGIPASTAAALAGVSALSQCKACGVVLGVASACLTGLLTFLDPKGRAAQHRDAGNSYKALNNDARIFRQVACQDGTSPAQLRKSLEELNARRNQLNTKSPCPSRWAFHRARKGIEGGEASYRIDQQPQSGKQAM